MVIQKDEKGGERLGNGQKWYQSKPDIAAFFIMLLVVFLTSPSYRAYHQIYHAKDDLGLLNLITFNIIATVESLFISQKHYWVWMPISIVCMTVVAFLSDVVFFGKELKLLDYGIQDVIYDWINGLIFFIFSIPWLLILFFIRKQVRKIRGDDSAR